MDMRRVAHWRPRSTHDDARARRRDARRAAERDARAKRGRERGDDARGATGSTRDDARGRVRSIQPPPRIAGGDER